jgi:hypothetical protein
MWRKKAQYPEALVNTWYSSVKSESPSCLIWRTQSRNSSRSMRCPGTRNNISSMDLPVLYRQQSRNYFRQEDFWKARGLSSLRTLVLSGRRLECRGVGVLGPSRETAFQAYVHGKHHTSLCELKQDHNRDMPLHITSYCRCFYSFDIPRARVRRHCTGLWYTV